MILLLHFFLFHGSNGEKLCIPFGWCWLNAKENIKLVLIINSLMSSSSAV